MLAVSRTPPGVRELKLSARIIISLFGSSRTPPGVRELKLPFMRDELKSVDVAPLPGCVN